MRTFYHYKERLYLRIDAIKYRWYAQKLLKDSSIDVIHVCTPNNSHAEITIAGLHADKHVMCEKPMAKTSKEARAT